MIGSIRLVLLLCSSVLLFGCGGSAVRPLQERPVGEPQPEVEVLVVDLDGVLGTVEVALCHRALREANGKRVVFRMTHAGGMAESSSEVLGLLDGLAAARQDGVITTAALSGKVTGGAAFLALLCDEIYFLRSGEIGAVTPMASTWEMIQELTDDDAERQRYRAYAQEMLRRLEQRRNKLPQDALRLCEGMADPALKLVRATLRQGGLESTRVIAVSELPELQRGGATILDQQEVTQPVVLSAREAIDAGIARGIVESMEHLCSDVLLVDRRLVGELQISWSETMVGWLELLQPALLILGFVLLVLELKTPGLGVSGFLGTVFLALGMFYSYLVGLADVGEILLFFLGIALLAVEIFLLPGMVVFGATGFVCLVLALVLSRQTFVLPQSVSQEEILFHNLLQLIGLFVAVIVFAAVMWRVLPKIPILNRMYLPAPEPLQQSGMSVAPSPTRSKDFRQALLGRGGRAVTVLRPTGTADIDGERVDVVTDGDYVSIGQEIRVIEVVGNRVVVEAVTPPPGGAAGVPGAPGRPGGGESGSVGLILLLMVLGLVFLVAEVFFVSFGVLFMMAAGAIFGAVFMAFQEGDGWGWAVLVVEAILAPAAVWAALRVLPRTSFGRALMLAGPAHEEVTGRAMEPGLSELMDQVGVTASALRPSGFARIAGRKVDVVTRGEMIEAGQRVRVIEVLGNRVVVKVEPESP